MNDIDHRISSFKADLVSLDPMGVARKNIVSGECAIITPSQYFSLKVKISSEFEVHPNDVLVVGSAKLGFSIAPAKRYRPFGDSSDLDVVIVSDRLFDIVWMDVHRYSEQGGYWERGEEFKGYLFRGWIRPDMLPPDHVFAFGRRWWEHFNSLSASQDFSTARVRGAIYKNWHFLESYQQLAVRACADELSQAKKDED